MASGPTTSGAGLPPSSCALVLQLPDAPPPTNGSRDGAQADDDDVTPDEDPCSGPSAPPQFAFSARVDGSAGEDDDDSAGDDDDSAPSPRGGSRTVEATFYVSLCVDKGEPRGRRWCDQRVIVGGVARFGTNVLDDCQTCTGVIEFNPATALDVSDPATSPGDCDPKSLELTGVSLGRALLSEVGVEPGHWGLGQDSRNWGDFLRIGLMDEAAQEAVAFDGSSTGAVDMTAGGNSEWVLSTYGADYTHAGFVFAPPDGDSLAATAQIWSVSNPAAADSPWHFNWVIAKDPAANDHVGADMEGDYFGFSRFIVSLGD